MESNHRTQLRRLPLCPLSYGAGVVELAGLRAARRGAKRVADGIRTRDHRDHNPGLYQLSYRHRAPDIVSAAAVRPGRNVRRAQAVAFQKTVVLQGRPSG